MHKEELLRVGGLSFISPTLRPALLVWLLSSLIVVSGCSVDTAAPVEFVRFDRITYAWDGPTRGNLAVPEELVDQETVVGEIESRRGQPGGMPLEDEPDDGYASSLAPGTPVYAVKGYAPSFRLAARWREEWALFEVVANPSAKKGSDLLDIGGKVAYVEIEEAYRQPREKETLALRDSKTVAALVDAVLAAPLERLPKRLPPYLLVFHLEDDTRSVYQYRPSSGALYIVRDGSYSGVVVPSYLRDAIERRLRG